MLKTKFIWIFFATLLWALNSFGQEEVKRGFYVHRHYFVDMPETVDTFRFEIYSNGAYRLRARKNELHITDYKDLKNGVINFELGVNENMCIYSKRKMYDTSKTVYQSHKGLYVYSVDSIRDKYGWRQTGYTEYSNDILTLRLKRLKHVRWGTCGTPVPMVLETVFLYDNKRRLVSEKNTVDGKIKSQTIYKYKPNFRMAKAIDSLNNIEIKEEYFRDGLLVREVIKRPERNYYFDTIYQYDSKKRLSKVDRFIKEMNLERRQTDSRILLYDVD